MVVYKFNEEKYICSLFASSHCITVSDQGSSLCEVPIKKSVNDFRVPMQSFVWLILTLSLLEKDLKTKK